MENRESPLDFFRSGNPFRHPLCKGTSCRLGPDAYVRSWNGVRHLRSHNLLVGLGLYYLLDLN